MGISLQTRTLRLLKINELVLKIGISRSSIYEKLCKKSPRYDANFPEPVKVGKRAIRFYEHEVEAWMNGLSASSSQFLGKQ